MGESANKQLYHIMDITSSYIQNAASLPDQGRPQKFTVFASVADGCADSLARGLTGTLSGIAHLSYQLGGAPPPAALETVEAVCGYAGLAIYPVMGLIRFRRACSTAKRWARRRRLGLSTSSQALHLAEQSTGIASAGILTLGSIPVIGSLPPLAMLKSAVAIGFGVSLAHWGDKAMKQARNVQANLSNSQDSDPKQAMLHKLEWIAEVIKSAEGQLSGCSRITEEDKKAYQEELRDIISDEVGPTVASHILAMAYAFNLGSEKKTGAAGWQYLKELLAKEDAQAGEVMNLCERLISILETDAQRQYDIGQSLFWIGIFLALSQTLALILRCIPATSGCDLLIELAMFSSIFLSGVQLFSIVADYQSYRLAKREDEKPFIQWLQLWQEDWLNVHSDCNLRIFGSLDPDETCTHACSNINNIPAII